MAGADEGSVFESRSPSGGNTTLGRLALSPERTGCATPPKSSNRSSTITTTYCRLTSMEPMMLWAVAATPLTIGLLWEADEGRHSIPDWLLTVPVAWLCLGVALLHR
jgi:hypothetical protein